MQALKASGIYDLLFCRLLFVLLLEVIAISVDLVCVNYDVRNYSKKLFFYLQVKYWKYFMPTLFLSQSKAKYIFAILELAILY